MSCIQLYYVCVFIGINRTDEALPMSCIQMYYVCVFIDKIGQTSINNVMYTNVLRVCLH
jgi:hypothetical protein